MGSDCWIWVSGCLLLGISSAGGMFFGDLCWEKCFRSRVCTASIFSGNCSSENFRYAFAVNVQYLRDLVKLGARWYLSS